MPKISVNTLLTPSWILSRRVTERGSFGAINARSQGRSRRVTGSSSRSSRAHNDYPQTLGPLYETLSLRVRNNGTIFGVFSWTEWAGALFFVLLSFFVEPAGRKTPVFLLLLRLFCSSVFLAEISSGIFRSCFCRSDCRILLDSNYGQVPAMIELINEFFFYFANLDAVSLGYHRREWGLSWRMCRASRAEGS